MPNIKSAIKRDAQSKARHAVNLANKSRLHTASLKFRAVAAEGDAAKSAEALRVFMSEIDKAAKKGAITKNAAARRKSRAAALVAKKA